jgi:hypothetical protein
MEHRAEDRGQMTEDGSGQAVESQRSEISSSEIRSLTSAKREGNMNKKMSAAGWCVRLNAVVLAVIGIYFFLIPVLLVFMDIRDPAWRGDGIPKIAWRVHKHVTPLYERYARERISSGVAATLDLYDVPSTEWPVFGSVFYLMATENLQKEWEKNPSLSRKAPKEYARDTIEAAKDLLVDTNHHWWVRTHWGDDYLHTENVFFRALLISGLTSYDQLTGNTEYRPFLKDQCLTLSEELDKSPHGILDDYPAECYPIDVLAAIANIQRTSALLGLDTSAFVKRSRRAFEGKMLDKRGMIPYAVDSKNGRADELYQSDVPGVLEGPSRGIGNSYVLIYARELWPDLAESWYSQYEKYFWQKKFGAEGFREFPKGMPDQEFTYDVDVGPIVFGFGPAGNAYGVAGARANGRMDHSYTLASQVLAACWPLWNGDLLGARFLSHKHAPYLGAVNLLWLFTITPQPGAARVTGGTIPPFTFILTGFLLVVGCLIVFAGWRTWRRAQQNEEYLEAVWQKFQCAVWLCFIVAGSVVLAAYSLGYGLVCLLFAQLLPRFRNKKSVSTVNNALGLK